MKKSLLSLLTAIMFTMPSISVTACTSKNDDSFKQNINKEFLNQAINELNNLKLVITFNTITLGEDIKSQVKLKIANIIDSTKFSTVNNVTFDLYNEIIGRDTKFEADIILKGNARNISMEEVTVKRTFTIETQKIIKIEEEANNLFIEIKNFIAKQIFDIDSDDPNHFIYKLQNTVLKNISFEKKDLFDVKITFNQSQTVEFKRNLDNYQNKFEAEITINIIEKISQQQRIQKFASVKISDKTNRAEFYAKKFKNLEAQYFADEEQIKQAILASVTTKKPDNTHIEINLADENEESGKINWDKINLNTSQEITCAKATVSVQSDDQISDIEINIPIKGLFEINNFISTFAEENSDKVIEGKTKEEVINNFKLWQGDSNIKLKYTIDNNDWLEIQSWTEFKKVNAKIKLTFTYKNSIIKESTQTVIVKTLEAINIEKFKIDLKKLFPSDKANELPKDINIRLDTKVFFITDILKYVKSKVKTVDHHDIVLNITDVDWERIKALEYGTFTAIFKLQYNTGDKREIGTSETTHYLAIPPKKIF